MQHAGERREVRERQGAGQAGEQRVGAAVGHAGEQHALAIQPVALADELDDAQQVRRIVVLRFHDRPRAVHRGRRDQDAAARARLAHPAPQEVAAVAAAAVAGDDERPLAVRRVVLGHEEREAAALVALVAGVHHAEWTVRVALHHRALGERAQQRHVLALVGLQEQPAHGGEHGRERIQQRVGLGLPAQRAVHGHGVGRAGTFTEAANHGLHLVPHLEQPPSDRDRPGLFGRIPDECAQGGGRLPHRRRLRREPAGEAAGIGWMQVPRHRAEHLHGREQGRDQGLDGLDHLLVGRVLHRNLHPGLGARPLRWHIDAQPAALAQAGGRMRPRMRWR